MVVLIGDLREEFGKDLLWTIEEVIRRKKHLRNPYYLLVYSDIGLDVVDPRGAPGPTQPGTYMKIEGKTVIKTKVIILPEEPNRQKNLEAALKGEIQILGMMCFKVDNIRGELWRLWTLPQNIPDYPGLVQEDRVIEDVLEDAQMVGRFIQ